MARPIKNTEVGESAAIPLEEHEKIKLLSSSTLLHPERVPERVCILMTLRYALRSSEGQALTFRHIAGRMLFVVGKKRGKAHRYEIDPQLREHLDRLRVFYQQRGVFVTNETFLFMTRKGRQRNIPMSTVHMNRFLAQIRGELCLEERVTSHSLRKTAITEFQSVVEDPFVTQELSRHKSILSLMPYVKARKFKHSFREYLNTLERKKEEDECHES